MRAINPKTGKPITILKTEATITKNNRTLLWYRQGLTGTLEKWRRWSTLVTEDDPLDFQPDIVFLHTPPTPELTAKWKSWLLTATNASFIIATPKWLEALRLNAAVIPSLLATTEIYQRYPFLPDLKDTDPKSQWLLTIAQLMRFHQLVTPLPLTDNAESKIFTGKITLIDHAASSDSLVPSVWLIQQYFVPSKAKREREIRLALEKNLACPTVDKIVLLNEKIYLDLPASSKLEQVNIGKRLTYYDMLSYIKVSVPKDTIVVFSNSDIYVDDSLRQLYSIDLNKKFLALLRYDVQENPAEEPVLFGPRADSQDTWILWSSSLDFEITPNDFGFNFGVPGCDNALTLAMLQKKFIVSNPALSIKTYHLHNSNIRNYIVSDVLDKPVFLYAEPTGIQEYNIVKDVKKYRLPSWPKSTPSRTFQRPIKYVDRITAETICKMMPRNQEQEHYNFSVDSANTFNKAYAPEDNILYKFTNPTNTVFTMPAGVLCDFDNIFIGEHPKWKDEWSKAPLTILTNTVHVPSLAAVHLPQHLSNSASQWFLHYLPSVLKIHLHTGENPEFIASVHPDTQRALKLLQMPTKEPITMIPYLPDCQYVSEQVYALTPPSFPEVPAENIDLLRNLLPTQEPNANPVAVICAELHDGALMSTEFCNELIKSIFHRKDRGMWTTQIIDTNTPTETRLQALMKADLVIAQSQSAWDALDWSWLMKSNSTVVEAMPDIAPRGEHIHIAGAANLNYVLLGVKREPLPYQRLHMLEDMEKIMNQHLFAANLKAQVPKNHLPIVTLPVGKALTGIHSHAGDTFREMVEIWESRDYCTVERREDTPYVWWQGVGNVLLYDRPTMRWFTASAPAASNPSYNLALFGNCFPEKPTRNDRPWSFWSRSPKAVESIVATNQPLTSYEARAIPSIFLGRIENGIQKERRETQDWSKAIHTFSMPIDSTGGPYKYNQETYLSMLCQSRFGLCLPGYGPKCNREIEYFATGTVPIITPGVDMTFYASKPKEGVHYFSAKTPEDITHIVNNTSAEKWTEMSIAGRAWWRRYASAEGLFRLTWGLVNDNQHQHGINCCH